MALIEVKNHVSGDAATLTQENAKPTGNIAWIRRSAAARIFKVEIPAKTALCFIGPGVLDTLRAMQEASDSGTPLN